MITDPAARKRFRTGMSDDGLFAADGSQYYRLIIGLDDTNSRNPLCALLIERASHVCIDSDNTLG
jgi:hypothetical protein